MLLSPVLRRDKLHDRRTSNLPCYHFEETWFHYINSVQNVSYQMHSLPQSLLGLFHYGAVYFGTE
jgi:hypothetical protein